MTRLLWILPLLAVFSGVLIGAHMYLADRLVHQLELPPAATQALLGVIVAGAVSLVLQPIAERTVRPSLSRWVAWPAHLWMGIVFILTVLLGFSDLLIWLGGAVAYAQGGETVGLSDRDLAHARAGVVLALAVVAVAFGLRSALGRPVVKRVELTLERWPRARNGFRLIQISDVHIGPILGRRFAHWITNRVNSLEPDLVAITGDLVDGRVSLLADEVAPFADLRARLGVFFVTGNHDHYSDASSWVQKARELGFRVLRNDSVLLGEAEGSPFRVAGVDDHRASMLPGEHGEDLELALADVDAASPVLLLAHDPSTFKRASSMGVDLQLSGHTHGGQIWPFGHVVRLVIPFVAGLYRRGAARLYVSRGTGFWGPPLRLFAPAEITEIILRSASSVAWTSGESS